MANKKLRFVALIVVALALVCMLVACTTTTTKANYNVIIHLGDGRSDITWDRQADFPTLSREHYTVEGLYLDAEFKTATSEEDLKAMWLTADIDVYVNWAKIIYKITVHPANGEQDVIWEPAPGNKAPEFTKVGYIMDGFYFDENCTQSADSVFAEELLEHKEVWVKWSECDHKAVTEWTTDSKPTCTEAGHKIATCPTCAKELEDTITALGHNSDGVVPHKDADCINAGVVGGTYCTRCGLGEEDAEKAIPALGHKYGTVSYVWSADNKTCTASRTCANDASHVETETVNVEATVVQNKTCTLDELTTYVATFENSAFATQTKANIKTADKTGHKYGEVSYVWSADNKTCTATRTCANDASHVETETVDAEATVTQHSSCTTVELTTYVATFENSAFTQQKKENVQTANAGEHNYTEFVEYTKEPTCTESGKAIYKCSGCTGTKEIDVDALGHDEVKHDAQDPTCTEKGWEAYVTCSRCDYTTYKETPATGHEWNEVEYTWNDDYTQLTATRVCKNDASHIETETVNVKATVVQNKTCTLDELTTYVATFENSAFATQTKANIKTADKTGHNSEGHVDHVDATCTSTGIVGGTYCTRCDNGKEAAETIIPIDSTNHTYGDLVAKVDADCTTDGKEAHYHCACGQYFNENKEAVEESELTIKAGHTYGDLIEAVEAGDSMPAIAAHYHCAVCDKYFDESQKGVEYSTLITVDKTKTYTVTARYTDSSKNTNMSEKENNATIIGLNGEIFNVKSTVYNDYSTHVGLNKDGTIRIYQMGSGNKYCDLTISISKEFISQGFVIESVQVELGNGRNNGVLAVTDGTTTMVGDDENVYEINGNTVVFYNSNTANSQVWIKSIIINYGVLSDEKQAQAKADEVANNLTLDDIKLSNVGDKYEELPTSKDGATITWSVVDGNGYVSCESNVLTVTTKPTGTDARISLTATVSVTINDVTETATKTFDDIITVYADEIKHSVSIATNKLVTIIITDGENTIDAGDQVVDNTDLIISVALNPSNNGMYTFVVKNGDKELPLEDGHYSVKVNADVNISVVTTPVLDTPEQIVGAAYDLEDGKDLGKQTLEGKVTKIDTEYSTQYGNISVTIQIGKLTDNTILCFRMKGTGAEYIAVGDTIKVTGTLINYGGTIEFNTGCTFVYTCQSTVNVNVAEDIKATVTIGGESVQTSYAVTKGSEFIISIALDDGYQANVTTDGGDSSTLTASGDCKLTIKGNTTITIATAEKSTSGGEGSGSTSAETTITKSIKDLGDANGWSNNTTKQLFKLDDVVSCEVGGGANSGKFYTDQIRIYATDSPAGSLTIKVAEGYQLVSVKISCVTGTYAYLTVGDDTATDISNTLTTVSGSSVVLKAVKNGDNGKQVRVTAIEVVYKQA